MIAALVALANSYPRSYWEKYPIVTVYPSTDIRCPHNQKNHVDVAFQTATGSVIVLDWRAL